MKKSVLVALLVVAGLSLSMNAYAGLGGENCPLAGMCNSIGGFLFNALPWNWGNWMGK